MTNEDKTFELMTKMYVEFSQKFKDIEVRITGLEGTVSSMDKTLIKIENEHGGKLSALFDG